MMKAFLRTITPQGEAVVHEAESANSLELYIKGQGGESVLHQVEERDGTLHCHSKGDGNSRLTVATPGKVIDVTRRSGLTGWRQGNTCDSIITGAPIPLHHQNADCMEHYGGYVVAESVPEHFRPLILAAPDLLKGARAFTAYTEHLSECESCDEQLCEKGGELYADAERLLTVAVARVPKSVFPEHYTKPDGEGPTE